MGTEIWVAVLSLIGTLMGSLFGILTANKLTSHRLAQLEKKVDKHNNLVERMVMVEEKLKSNSHSIIELEKLKH